MKAKHILIAPILLLTTVFTSCKKDKNDPQKPQPVINEEEVITTCKIVFQDAAGILPEVTALFQDPDGDGGNPPAVFDTIRLAPNANYHAEIILLNETTNPADTISNEVAEEGVDHLFCFQVNAANLSITRTDSDGVYEIGLKSDWATGAPSNGDVTVTLKHQPGIKNGTCEPGDTDIEIQFPMEIE